MPFGLKVASSLFQKAMLRIFEPILYSALVYIDDILVFFEDHIAHEALLAQFFKLTDKYEIMLSKKKSILVQPKIEYVGSIFINGHFQIEPHLVEGLVHFPDENLTRKEIQSFLGIINYVSLSY